MADPFIENIVRNEAILKKLSDDAVMLLAISEMCMEMTSITDVPGSKAKFVALSAELSKRAGIKW